MSFAIITRILVSRSHSKKSKIEVFRKINSYIDHSFEELHPALEVCKENRPHKLIWSRLLGNAVTTLLFLARVRALKSNLNMLPLLMMLNDDNNF